MKIMKLYKNLLPMLLAAAAFTACGEQDAEDYEGGATDALATYGTIYFPTTSYTVELEPTDPTTYEIPLSRVDSTSALTVPIVVLGNDTITASDAQFAAGQATTTITLNFPNAVVGTPYKVNISAEGASYLTPCSFTITRVKWNDAGFYYDESGQKVEGYADYTDDLLTTFYGIDNTTHPVKLQERDDKPGYFRLVNPYGAGYYYNEEGDYDADNDYYILIDATNPDQVYIPERCRQGTDYGYGQFIVFSYAGYWLEKGDADKAASYYGTYANGKITFPAGGLLFGMANYNSGGLYSSNNNGAFCVVVDPDQNPYTTEITSNDFEWESVFTGSFTSGLLGNESSATLMKGTCTNTTDSCDVAFYEEYGTAYRIESPYAEGYPIYFAVDSTGAVNSPVTMQATGIQALGVDVYATINAKQSSFSERIITLNITFTNSDGTITYGTTDEILSNITWTQVSTGTYTYLADMWGDGAVDTNLALLKRDDKDDTYKITNWLMGVDYTFTWDKATNLVEVSDQYCGYTHSSYGDVYVVELCQYASSTSDMPSSYYDPDEQTFHFYVIYYVSAGYFAYGEETFVLDSAASAKPNRAKSSGMKALKQRGINKGMKRGYKLTPRYGMKQNMKNAGTALF